MNIVLDDLTAGWLEPNLPDQWLPLPELLTVECPNCTARRSVVWFCHLCEGHGRVPMPEGVYDIGTERTEVCTWTADGERRQLETTWFVPLALGVHLRQVEWGEVERWPSVTLTDMLRDKAAWWGGNDGKPRCHRHHRVLIRAKPVDDVSGTHLCADCMREWFDLYNRLAVSVDGGPPAAVLNVRSEK